MSPRPSAAIDDVRDRVERVLSELIQIGNTLDIAFLNRAIEDRDYTAASALLRGARGLIMSAGSYVGAKLLTDREHREFNEVQGRA